MKKIMFFLLLVLAVMVTATATSWAADMTAQPLGEVPHQAAAPTKTPPWETRQGVEESAKAYYLQKGQSASPREAQVNQPVVEKQVVIHETVVQQIPAALPKITNGHLPGSGHEAVCQEVKSWDPVSASYVDARDAKVESELRKEFKSPAGQAESKKSKERKKMIGIGELFIIAGTIVLLAMIIAGGGLFQCRATAHQPQQQTPELETACDILTSIGDHINQCDQNLRIRFHLPQGVKVHVDRTIPTNTTQTAINTQNPPRNTTATNAQNPPEEETGSTIT